MEWNVLSNMNVDITCRPELTLTEASSDLLIELKV